MKTLIFLEDALNIAMQYCPDDDGSCSKSGVDIREMLDELESLPSAESEQQWIPCSKRSPKKDGDYLVWMSWGRPGHEITVATYRGGYWDIKTAISAWMPRPEPYKEV